MKLVFVFGILLSLVLCHSSAFAQMPSPSPIPVASAPADVSVQVAEPAAPPQWAQNVIVTAQHLPVVGPYVSKALMYAGIVSSILTALVACMLSILSVLVGAFNISGLAGIASAIDAFKKGKVMYWLSYLSMFNAKKPEAKIESVSAESVKGAA